MRYIVDHSLRSRSGVLSASVLVPGIVAAQYIARHILKCISPVSFNSQLVTVEVSSNGVDYTSDMVQFHYQRPAMVTTVEPSIGPITGYTIINIYGANFVDSSSLFCAFGESVPTLWQRKGYKPSTQCTYITNINGKTETCSKSGAETNGTITFACFVRAHWITPNHIQCIAPPFQPSIVTIEVTSEVSYNVPIEAGAGWVVQTFYHGWSSYCK